MDELGLPRSTLQKAIKDTLPQDMRIASDSSDLLVQCCNQFVHLISTQANDISEREKRSTISPEHVVRAVEELEFGPQYVEAVKAALEEWKQDNKEHHQKGVQKKGGAKDSGLTQEQLIELQHKLFEEARAATLSGPLPPVAAAQVAATAPAAGVEQGGAGVQPQQQQQQPEGSGPEAGQQEQQRAAAAAVEGEELGSDDDGL